MGFAPSFFYLQQETLLAEATLGAGLTSIRKGNLSDRGALYQGFFEASIGIERLLKVLLVAEHMVSNELTPPSNDWLRDHGHDLLSLYRSICITDDSDSIVSMPVVGSIDFDILNHLSQFAQRTRYYNLDALSGASRGSDPLSEWGKILERILLDDVSEKKRVRLRSQAREIGNAIADHVSVVAHDLDSKPLDHVGILEAPALQNAAAPYAVWRLVEMLRPVRHRLDDAGKRGYSASRNAGDSRLCIPDFADFLLFLEVDRRSALQKRRWP